jgi:phage shock protein C
VSAGDSPRRLRRSHDRMIGGVAAGIAEYVDVDPTLVRLFFVLLLILGAGFTWLVVYLVLWLVMPAPAPESAPTEAVPPEPAEHRGGTDPGLVFGILLVGFGVLLLANQFVLFRFIGFGAARFSWPLLLIAAGAMLFLAARDRDRR